MSTDTSTKTQAKPYGDGGTIRTIQAVDTRNGWGVEVCEWTTYRGATIYVAHRVSPAGYIHGIRGLRTTYRIACGTEAECRRAANREWLSQMGRPVPSGMIH